MTLRNAATFGLTLLALVACGEAGQSATPAVSASNGSGSGSASARSSVPSVTRTFGNWTAVCNNANDCWAYAKPANYESGWLLLHYPAGPSSRVEVKVGDWSDTPGPLTLSIDGQPIPASASLNTEQRDVAMIDLFDDLPGFVSHMARGQTLAVQNADPENSPSISLQGAYAAFLWIDERQGRLGTSTALVSRGERPLSAVPDAPDLPLVQAAPLVSQAGLTDSGTLAVRLEALPAVRTCRADVERVRGSSFPDQTSVARLSEDTLLWSVLCFQGAYNEGHRFFLTDDDGANPRPLLLPTTDQEGEDAGQDDDYIVINAGFDLDRRTISSFSKGRGLGDCGAAYVWTWTGREFTLTDERVMQDCAGMWADLWPVTWRSR